MTDDRSKARVAVFISGGGTNLQALIDASREGSLEAEIVLVVSNNRKAYGLVRAKEAGIDTFVFKTKKYPAPEAAAAALMAELAHREVDYIALAGYLKLLPREVVRTYRNRIINIHPGPLPKYGGQGMYGQRVHEAVIANQESQTEATVHLVDEIYDHGRVLETRSVEVKADDTPETLSERVLRAEHELYPRALNKLIRGDYDIDN